MQGSQSSIGVTPNHPFWSEDQQAFIPVGELSSGDSLRSGLGKQRVIASIKPGKKQEVVYNLEVHTEHAYLVGEAGILVHNAYKPGKRSVWNQKATRRGELIEMALQATEYRKWYWIGDTRHGFFPLIDFVKGRTLVSLKSVHTGGSTWGRRMMKHIDDLALGHTVGRRKARMELDLRVQPGGVRAAKFLVDYGKKQGVKVRVKQFDRKIELWRM
jgi:hypothetical protein